jgi:putative lipoprotein
LRRLGAVLLLVAALPACTGSRKAPAPSPEAAPTPEAAPVPVPTAPAAPVRETAVLRGTVTYRQRSALTPEAVVQIELRGAAAAGDPPTVVAKRIIERPGQVPIAFELPYDPSAIDPSTAYTVSARITDRGQLQFVTETPVPVLTRGAPPAAEIVVTPVR